MQFTMHEDGILEADDDGCFDCDSGYGPFASFDVSDWKQLEEQFRSTQIILEERAGKAITRLKKPRDLYAVSNHSNAQHSIRWPAEVQVLPFRPRHYHGQGKYKEPFYHQEEQMPAAPKSSDIFGKVVYDNSPDPAVKYFMRSRAGGKGISAQPYYALQGSSDKTLLFESRFESGNLMRAIKIGEFDYELWLRFDLYTKKNTQWYYFRVQNARPGIQYRFTIMNFMKSGSLYNSGMRPLLYSEHGSKNRSQGWIRVGSNIRYYRNDIRVEEGKDRYYYSLTWTCSFSYENDTCYFAHCYPYTYSDLQEYLTSITQSRERSKVCKQRVLCRTLAGNHIYALTITSPTRRPEEAQMKQAVVVTARVHPGETNSSWMMKGFLDYITSEAPDAKILRDNFVFKVVPMLNPDGVIVGNYRCSLTGRDLNRNYKTVLKDSFPPVWHTRHMVRRLQEERSILLYCDFHGHSRKKNVFIYGCGAKKHAKNVLEDRVFPFMFSKNAPDKFSFDGCRFKVQKNKEGTGRIVMWNLGIMNSYTMEATFCGSSIGAMKGYHFTTADFQSMGYHFCDTLLDFCDPDSSKVAFVYNELERRITSAYIHHMGEEGRSVAEPSLEQSIAYISEVEADSGGSDSSVSDGLPMQLLYASVPELSRKKRLKTRKERNNRLASMTTKDRQTSMQEPAPKTQQAKIAQEDKQTKKLNPARTLSAKGRFGYSTSGKQGHRDHSSIVPSNVKERIETRVQNRAEYLDFINKAYLAHGKLESNHVRQGSPKLKYSRGKSALSHRSNSTCEICNAVYGSSNGSDFSDDDTLTMRAEEHDIYLSHIQQSGKSNLALGLAKQITSYNTRVRPLPPKKLGRIPTCSSLTKYNYQELLKRRTLNQGDNAEYVRKEIENILRSETTSGMESGNEIQAYTSGVYPYHKSGKDHTHLSIAECRVSENPTALMGVNETDMLNRPIGSLQSEQLTKKRLPTLKKSQKDQRSHDRKPISPTPVSTFLADLHSQSGPKPLAGARPFSGETKKHFYSQYSGETVVQAKHSPSLTLTQKRCPERRSFTVGSTTDRSHESLKETYREPSEALARTSLQKPTLITRRSKEKDLKAKKY